MIRCDLCGKPVSSSYDLEQLLSSYQTESVVDVCVSCRKDINAHLWKVRELYEPLVARVLKRYIRFRRMEIHNERKRCTKGLNILSFKKNGEGDE